MSASLFLSFFLLEEGSLSLPGFVTYKSLRWWSFFSCGELFWRITFEGCIHVIFWVIWFMEVEGCRLKEVVMLMGLREEGGENCGCEVFLVVELMVDLEIAYVVALNLEVFGVIEVWERMVAFGVSFPARFKHEEGWRTVANGVYCSNGDAKQRA
ncbi:PREDICTED: uncharacterized protein LOC109186405 isoform X2 [Ipomoea nil]|uniref:uncharacterized protein LOC109186405 isoform X1 n=1 Tax=Ipomoea nil TaxID=35883 RepID=UPI0009019B1D|nr:PREDICTED: uncharacterized protein LOC109186405 isoform X1 [Ipomoea nil]XP_019191912.1 PREDICTED: uncharacterized protein LOC109186405 isoform X2 [Ipomoea nil]